MKKKFNWGYFLKRLAALGIPVALQQLLSTTASMVDTMMIAKLGEQSVGAVGLCSNFSYVAMSGVFGFLGGGTLFISQYWGNKDEDAMDRSYGIMLMFVMSIGIIFCALSRLCPGFIMRIYTNKEAIQNIGIDYLKIACYSYPLMIFAMAMSTMLRSTEHVKIPLFASIFSVLTNVFLNWVLIYGNLGAPEMGVRGAALATVIANSVNVIFCLVFARLTRFKYLFQIRKHFAFNFTHVKEYMKKCFAILMNEGLLGVSSMLINMVYGRQAESAIAAVAVFRTIEGVIIGFFVGFSSAASILVGKSVGAGELDEAYERAKRLVLSCGVIVAMASIGLLCLRVPIFTAMSLSGESLETAKGMIAIYAVAVVIRMCNWIQNDTYRSAGDPNFGTIMEISFMYVLVLPLMLLGGLVWHWPFLLIFAASFVDEPIRVVIMQIHMYSGKWVKPVTPEGKAALPEFRKKHNIAPKRAS